MRPVLLALICLLSFAPQAVACWKAPPPIVWKSSVDGSHDLRIETKRGRVTVFAADNRQDPLWTVAINDYSCIFSRLRVSNDGQSVAHVLGNHQVRSLDATVIEVYRKKGSVFSVAARQVVDCLPQRKVRESTAPSHVWLKNVSDTGDRLTVVAAYGGLCTLSYRQPQRAVIVRGVRVENTSWYTKEKKVYQQKKLKKGEFYGSIQRLVDLYGPGTLGTDEDGFEYVAWSDADGPFARAWVSLDYDQWVEDRNFGL